MRVQRVEKLERLESKLPELAGGGKSSAHRRATRTALTHCGVAGRERSVAGAERTGQRAMAAIGDRCGWTRARLLECRGAPGFCGVVLWRATGAVCRRCDAQGGGYCRGGSDSGYCRGDLCIAPVCMTNVCCGLAGVWLGSGRGPGWCVLHDSGGCGGGRVRYRCLSEGVRGAWTSKCRGGAQIFNSGA